MKVGSWARGFVSMLVVWQLLSVPAFAAEVLWGLTTANTLVRFASAAPGTILATLPITGLPGGEQIVAIEAEKWEGRLTCISSAGRRYEVDRTTGAATQLSPAQPIITPAGTAFGVSDDFFSLTVVSTSGTVVSIDKTTGAQTLVTLNPPVGHLVAYASRYPQSPYRLALDSVTDTIYQLQVGAGFPTFVPIGPLGSIRPMTRAWNLARTTTSSMPR